MKMPCTYEFSRGRGTGVAEALGNWGFSNRISNNGQEVQRLKCLLTKMNDLRSNKPVMCIEYNRKCDPDTWYVKPSPDECKPAWTFPLKRPLITYSSTRTTILSSNLNEIGSDLHYVIPDRNYQRQGTDKWYRQNLDGCCQLSCLAPQCPVLHSCRD